MLGLPLSSIKNKLPYYLQMILKDIFLIPSTFSSYDCISIVYLSIYHLYPSLYQSNYLTFYISLLYTSLSIYLPIYLPIYLYIYQSIYLSFYLKGTFINFMDNDIDQPIIEERVWERNDFNYDNVVKVSHMLFVYIYSYISNFCFI